MIVVIQDNHFFFANQEVPVASDAVVESSLATKQRAIGLRADSELVPKALVVRLRSGEMVAPKFHEKP
jgi:hypothetical protein